MHLPLLERRRPELETCAFCPKLSRAACPVSNADGHETTTPWGKMSAAYYLEKGAVDVTPEQAWPPWACTGCFACREACELKNDVAGTLLDARADLLRAGVAPAAATEVVARHQARVADGDRGLDAVADRARARNVRVETGAPVRVVVGCLGARTTGPDERGDDPAVDAVVAIARLAEAPVDLVRGCCGSPLRNAGDRDGFVSSAHAMNDRFEGGDVVVVADAGCAHTITTRWRECGVVPRAKVRHLVELAVHALPRLRRVAIDGPLRYHDACHLGRGMGLYEPPRAVLSAILGRAPEEFARRREGATCTGGGGLVPLTAKATAQAIAEERRRQHEALGGGAIATTCASSRKQLARAGARVFDLATLLARALE